MTLFKREERSMENMNRPIRSATVSFKDISIPPTHTNTIIFKNKFLAK